MLDELGAEGKNILSLLSQLKLANLTADPTGNILSERTGSIGYPHVHAGDLLELGENEILTLPNDA